MGILYVLTIRLIISLELVELLLVIRALPIANNLIS